MFEIAEPISSAFVAFGLIVGIYLSILAIGVILAQIFGRMFEGIL